MCACGEGGDGGGTRDLLDQMAGDLLDSLPQPCTSGLAEQNQKAIPWRKCPPFLSQHAALFYKITNLELRVVGLPGAAQSSTGDVS